MYITNENGVKVVRVNKLKVLVRLCLKFPKRMFPMFVEDGGLYISRLNVRVGEILVEEEIAMGFFGHLYSP
jgi:hypothetical protein